MPMPMPAMVSKAIAPLIGTSLISSSNMPAEFGADWAKTATLMVMAQNNNINFNSLFTGGTPFFKTFAIY